MVSLLKRKILNKTAYWISYVKLMPVLKRLNESSLVVDCGANVGDISALFLANGASVIAFEPDPLAFGMLKKRFKGVDRINLINKAVSHKESTAKLYFHEKQEDNNDSAFTVSSSLVEDKVNIDSSNNIEIDTVDLDSFISNLGKPVDILKMDIEGAEIEVLKKLIRNETYKRAGLILVETHENKIPGHKEKVAELKETLRKLKIKNITLNWI